jgi:hypothetical protein
VASTGNTFPGTGANVDRSGLDAWSNPGNIVSDNTTDAISVASGGSDYLVASNFGFALPDGATITGVTVRVQASEHSAGTESLNAQLQNDSSTLVGSSKSATLNSTVKIVYTYGATNDSWGATLTPAIVNSSNFGVRFWFTTAHDVRVDYVTLAIEYVDSGTGVVRSDTAFGSRSPGYGVLSGGGVSPNLPLGLRGKVGPPFPNAVFTSFRNPLSEFGRGGLAGDAVSTLAVTEEDDTSAVSAQAISTGTLSRTEEDDTPTIVGRAPATGSVSLTEEDDTLSASAALPLVAGAPSYGVQSGGGIAPNLPLGQRGGLGKPSPGNQGITVFRPSWRLFDLAQGQQNERTSTLAVTEADDTSDIAADAIATATFAVTEADDTSSVSGLSDQVGAGSPGAPSYGMQSGGGISPNLPLGQRSKVGKPYPGSVGISTLHSTMGRIALLESQGIATRLDVIEQDDSLAAPGTVLISANGALDEGADTLAASSGTSGPTGVLAVAEDDDTSDITLYTSNETSLPSYGVRSGGGVVERFGQSPTVGFMTTGGPIGIAVFKSTLLSGISSVISGVSASVIVTEADDTVVASGTAPITSDLDLSEADDTLAASSQLLIAGSLSLTEENDSCSATSAAIRTGTIAVTEANDTLSAEAQQLFTGSVDVAEADDTCAASATTIPSCTVDVTEGNDTSSITCSVSISGSLEVTEGNDGLNVPIVTDDDVKRPAGKSKRRRRYILPDGTHVYATESEAEELAEEILQTKAVVKPAKRVKTQKIEIDLPASEPVFKKAEAFRIAFTQQAPIDEITLEKLRADLRRRRKKIALLLAS